jgi:hypothetical protein
MKRLFSSVMFCSFQVAIANASDSITIKKKESGSELIWSKNIDTSMQIGQKISLSSKTYDNALDAQVKLTEFQHAGEQLLQIEANFRQKGKSHFSPGGPVLVLRRGSSGEICQISNSDETCIYFKKN